MPLTPVAGVTRLRAFQLGLETTFGTTVAATRRYPWTYTPTTNPNWTKTANDTGTLDLAVAPYAHSLDLTGTSVGELNSNDLPTLISATVMGGLALTTSGTAKILTAAPSATSQDVIDSYTGQWFDDASGDAHTFGGGVVDQLTLDYPQDLGPIMATANWRFATLTYPGAPTGGLTVDAAPVPFYCGDTYFFVNDSFAAIGTSQLVSQVYGAQIQLSNNFDVKRFANGSNSMRIVQGLSRGERVLNFSLTMAQATAAIAEASKWIAASPTERFAEIRTTSSVAASAGIPHQMRWRIPGYWFTRAEAVINTNEAFTLQGQQIYDTTATYPFQVISQSTRAALT
jgi:hypothetical protein